MLISLSPDVLRIDEKGCDNVEKFSNEDKVSNGNKWGEYGEEDFMEVSQPTILLKDTDITVSDVDNTSENTSQDVGSEQNTLGDKIEKTLRKFTVGMSQINQCNQMQKTNLKSFQNTMLR